MTARRIAGPLGILATALVAAACSGTPAATGAGATTPAATTPAATTAVITPTEVATVGPAASSPPFSIGLPSGDKDLEALLPDQLGGKPMTKLSMTGDQFLGMGEGSGSSELQAALGTLGKTPADLSVAFGGTDDVTIVAWQVKGVPGPTILQGLTNAYEAAQNGTLSDANFAGKSVKKFVPSDPSSGDGTVYIYTHDDVVYIVGGDKATDALLTEAFSKLP